MGRRGRGREITANTTTAPRRAPPRRLAATTINGHLFSPTHTRFLIGWLNGPAPAGIDQAKPLSSVHWLRFVNLLILTMSKEAENSPYHGLAERTKRLKKSNNV